MELYEIAMIVNGALSIAAIIFSVIKKKKLSETEKEILETIVENGINKAKKYIVKQTKKKKIDGAGNVEITAAIKKEANLETSESKSI